MAEHYVIIGNGPSANSAAETMRDLSRTARVTMIGRETHGYYRPDLLPGYIAGTIDEQELYVHPLAHYSDLDIQLRLGQAVVQTNFSRNELTLDHKEIVRFDGLIIATGGVSCIPEPLQAYQDQMFTLKTIEDANRWKEALPHVDKVVLVGGDLTSLTFSRKLLDMGKRVAFVLDDRCFWPLSCDDPAKNEVITRIKKRGVEVVDGRKIDGITKQGDYRYTLNTGGGKVNAGLVGAFFGLCPNVKFLAGSGLQIERGILVDETLRTSFPGVYAAGDCAQVFSPKLRDYWVSIGYQNAKNLGRVAALNLLGSSVQAEAAGNSIFEVEGLSVSNLWWTEF